MLANEHQRICKRADDPPVTQTQLGVERDFAWVRHGAPCHQVRRWNRHRSSPRSIRGSTNGARAAFHEALLINATGTSGRAIHFPDSQVAQRHGAARRITMPEKRTIERARKDRRAGKAPTTQASEFVREEIDKIRHGEHGARSPQQAIAIGLSKARRAGVRLRPPRKGRAKARTRKSAAYAYSAGQHQRRTRRRPGVSRALSRVLKREPRSTVSRRALSAQARRAASRRTAAARSAAARKATRTK